jgi:hypothetical protein
VDSEIAADRIEKPGFSLLELSLNTIPMPFAFGRKIPDAPFEKPGF